MPGSADIELHTLFCARLLAHHRRTVYLNLGPRDDDLLNAVYVRYLCSSQSANFSDPFLFQVHYRRHTPGLDNGRLLHEPPPLPDQLERSLQSYRSRRIERTVLSQAVPGRSGRVDFMQPENGQTSQVHNRHRRLNVLGKDQHLIGAFKAQLPDIHFQDIVCVFEQFTDFAVIVVELTTHSNVLRSLPGKKEHPILHSESFRFMLEGSDKQDGEI